MLHQRQPSAASSTSSTPLSGTLTDSYTAALTRNQPLSHPLDLFPLLSNSRQQRAHFNPCAFTVQDILTPQECQALIDRAESTNGGFQVALVNTGPSGRGIHLPGYRDGQRNILDDTEFASKIWDRIKSYVPPTFGHLSVVGLNERMRFLKYSPGDKFEAHMDGEYRRQDGSGDRTKLTIQLYLNEACTGGATSFLDEKAFYSPKGADLDGAAKLAVHPKVGQLLVFQHDLLHEGSPVLGGVKYVIRSDILYGTPKN
ncbi:hypothetical protein BG004_002285 [Podila humilis]|nr:hypothetical protein BG004_002285 [Podila humilis]